MSEVTLHINDRDYRVRAKDGEEEQLVRAGRRVDAKCKEARTALGTLSDSSLFFYAALMLADEIEAGPDAGAPSTEGAEAVARFADTLESLARRLEKQHEET